MRSTDSPPPAVASLTDAARYLGISERSLGDMVKQQDIAYARVGPGGGRTVFRYVDLDAYLASRIVPARAS